MPVDATPDPEPIAFGQRLKILRTRRGMSREVLAGLVGKSASWVKAVEGGRLKTPKLALIYRLADALRVRDLSQLTGDERMPTGLFIGPGHPRLPQVRAAINRLPLAAAAHEPPRLDHVSARLARAWSARHSAPNHRDVVGALLPELIRDAQTVARQAETSAERRAAQAILSEVYSLTQFFLAYQPDSELLWRVAERALVAAQDSDDPHTIGIAAWLQAEAHRDSGIDGLDAADDVTRGALAYLVPLLPDATTDVQAIAGALRAAAGFTAARRGETGAAWGHWDTARAIALRLPDSYFHPVTSFGQAVMGAHAVTIAVELHAGGESVRQAAASEAAAIPSRPRRARHRIEEARGYQLDGQVETALATLERAHRAAPETIQYNGYARRIVLEESESSTPSLRRRASDLAVQLGVLAA